MADADYYVPLSSLVGSLGLHKFPKIGDDLANALRFVTQHVGVRQWRETWNDRDATVRGTGLWGGSDLAVNCGAFDLAIGKTVGNTAEIEFELSMTRGSLLSMAVALGEELGDLQDDLVDDPRVGVFARADGPPIDFRLILRNVSVHVRFRRDFLRKGKLVKAADGTPIRIDALAADGSEGDDTAEVEILPPRLILDSRRGVDLDLDDDQLLEIPPLLIVAGDQPYLGLLVSKLKIDLSTERSPGEAIARGFDEAWRGVYFEEIAILGMDRLFPTLPKMAAKQQATDRRIVELRNWFIGTEGMSGYFRLALIPTPPLEETQAERDAVFRGLAIEIEFDRGNVIKLGGEVTLRLRKTTPALQSMGEQGDYAIGFSARGHPEEGLLLEAVMRRPGPSGNAVGLFTLNDQLSDLLAGTLLLVKGVNLTGPMAPTLAVLALEAMLFAGWFNFKSITVESVKLRRREETLAGGGELIWLEFVIDFNAKIAIDIPGNILPGVPRIQTDPAHPITVVVRGLNFAWAWNHGDFTEAQLNGRPSFDLSFDPGNAVSFEVGDETIIKESPFSVTKVAIGEWERGMWFDLGLKYSGKAGDVAYSVVPSITRFYFLTDGSIDHVAVLGATFSLLVPMTIYARGEWTMTDTSDVMTGRAYIIGKSGSKKNYKEPRNWLYNLGFGRRQVPLPPPPEPKRVEADMFFLDFETSSGIPTFILPGTNLYGISYLHAEHARPAIGSGTPAQWITQPPKAYQVDIDKWEPLEGASGWAAGVVLGAKADRAQPWNLKAGFIRMDPGPVLMLFGTANFLKQRLSVKDTNPAALTFYATLDIDRGEFMLGVRYEKKMPDATGSTLKLSIPAELYIGDGWHLYLGQDKPVERHMLLELFGKIKVSGYAMFDTATITNLAETGIDVPGTAAAGGLRFGFEGGRRKGKYKAYFYLKAAADGAWTLSTPRMFLIRAYVAGGLVVRAWGLGFEFEISAYYLWIRPEPDHDKGVFKVTLDLPWPIPNLSLTFDSTRGADGEGEGIPDSLVEGLSLYLRSTQSSVEHRGDLVDVPLNPIFSLAFRYPTRNGTAVPGSFNLSDGSVTTLYYAGGDPASPRGYAITLDALTLFEDSGGVLTPVPGPFPALWRPDPQAAAGGRPDKRILELFAYEGIEASRFISAAADYVDWTAQDFDPCPPLSEPEPVCYRFDAEALGFIDSDRHVTTGGDARVLLMSSVGEEFFAESIRRYFRTLRLRAEVVASPIAGLAQRLVRLPATNGTTPPVAAGDRLRLRFQRSEEATVLVLRYPGGIVRMRGYLLDTLVADVADGVFSGHLGEDRFEIVTYTIKGPLDRIEIEAAHGPGLRLRQSLVLQVCLRYTSDVEQWQDQQVAGFNWSQFWSDLLSQDAAASSALVLKAGTRYTLEIKSSWQHVHEDGTLGSVNATTDTFSFTTTTTPPATLRGPAAGLDDTDWEVKTLPLDGDDAVYTSRPIRLEFRDARTDKVYAAFGQRLALRFVDEHGNDLFDRLDFLRENATDLPEYQRAWQDHVLTLPCAPPGLETLWSKGVAHFDSVLANGVRYDAALVMLPATITDLSTVDDWTPFPVVYRFGFRTSRYASLTAHLAAHELYDELCEDDVDLAAVFAALGAPPAGTRRADDLLLEDVMLNQLHLLPRAAPMQPELIRVWRRVAGDPLAVELIALVVDGPEAFLRVEDCALAIENASASVPFVIVEQRGGARTLVLFPSAVAPGTLTLRVTATFTDANGAPATEVATRPVEVPVTPAMLAEEGAP